MWQRFIQIIFFAILISLLAIVRFSLIGAWPAPFNQINLELIIVIFILFFFGWRNAAWAALILGFWLDLISFHFFGLYLISLLLTVLAAYFLLKNWLTNRSLYSFTALIIAATVINNLLVALFLMVSNDNGQSLIIAQKDFWLNLLYQNGWSLLAALLLFNLAAFLTKKLRPGFLEKKRYL